MLGKQQILLGNQLREEVSHRLEEWDKVEIEVRWRTRR